MDYEKKTVKLEGELQASNIGADMIAEAMRKGKVNYDSRLYGG